MTDHDGRAPLIVAAAQPVCVPYDVAANAVAHAAAVRAAAARVVVFPELSLTGYELDAPELTAGDARRPRPHDAERAGSQHAVAARRGTGVPEPG